MDDQTRIRENAVIGSRVEFLFRRFFIFAQPPVIPNGKNEAYEPSQKTKTAPAAH